jgi:hypothetical protein
MFMISTTIPAFERKRFEFTIPFDGTYVLQESHRFSDVLVTSLGPTPQIASPAPLGKRRAGERVSVDLWNQGPETRGVVVLRAP